MNQRGQFLSIPALTCAPIDEFARQLLGLRFYSPRPSANICAPRQTAIASCSATGANLPSYNSTENAADFADLRTALGISQWNVFGVSYGSDLAQQYVRDHPEGIRSVVLNSVIPITITYCQILGKHACRVRQPFSGMRGRSRLQRGPSQSRSNRH